MKQHTKILEFKVTIDQDDDGWFIAHAPQLPGAHTQGKTLDQTIKNIKEVIELCLEEAKENPSYMKKIRVLKPKKEKTGFTAVTTLPITYNFS